ncbi:MAG: C25 family cysteine peptidase [Candidatus Zixiibacteriota bacterium]
MLYKNKFTKIIIFVCLVISIPGLLSAADEDYLIISHNSLNGDGLINLEANIESRGHSVYRHLIGDGITADDIKAFIENRYYNSRNLPRYVLLVGATRYIEGASHIASAANSNFIPGFYAENYFGVVCLYDIDYVNFDPLPLVNERQETSFPNIIIGRLPAVSNEDIQNYVDKLNVYQANIAAAEWKDDVLMLVGDKDRGTVAPPAEIIVTQMNDIAANHIPSTMEISSIAYTDYTDALVRLQDIITSIDAGKLFVYNMATGANPLNIAYMIQLGSGDGFDAYTDLSVNDKYPVVFGASCSIGQSDGDYEGQRFLAENFLFAPLRGAIAFLGPAGATSQYANYVHSRSFYDIFSEHPYWTLGQVATAAQIDAYRNEKDAGLMDTHEMYTYYGDPSLLIYNDSLDWDETVTYYNFELDSELPGQNEYFLTSNHIINDTCRPARCVEPDQKMMGAYCLKVAGEDIYDAPGPALTRWELFDVSIPITSETRFMHFYERAISHPNNVARISLNCLLESGAMLSDLVIMGPPKDQYGNGLAAADRVDPLSPDKPVFYAFDISCYNGDRITKILAEYDAASTLDQGRFEAYFDEIVFSETWGNSPVVGEINMVSSLYKGNTTSASISAEDLSDQVNKGDQLNYDWSATQGSFTGEGCQVTYNAPSYTYNDVVITCVVSDLGGHEITKTKIIDITEQSSGGCPYVYIWSNGGYVKDNVILTESEDNMRANTVVVDYLPLTVMPDNDGGFVKLKIAEYENEISYIDQIEILAYPDDLTADEQLAIDKDGRLVAISHLISPKYAGSSLGNDLSANIMIKDGKCFEYYGAGDLTIAFPNLDSIYNYEGGLAKPAEQENSVGTVIEDPDKNINMEKITIISEFESAARGNFVTVSAVYNDGSAIELNKINPRAGHTLPALTDITEYVTTVRQPTLKIRWNQFYRADVISACRYRPLADPELIRCVSAVDHESNSRLGLIEHVDRENLKIMPGEHVELKFPVPTFFDRAHYVLKVTGYYKKSRQMIDPESMPEDIVLGQNYPNPFNPITKIELALPSATEWKLEILNVVGQVVDRISGYSEGGNVVVEWDASEFASGIYFYRASARNYSVTRKMILVK